MPVTREDLQKYEAVIETIIAPDGSEMVMKLHQLDHEVKTVLRVPMDSDIWVDLENMVVESFSNVYGSIGFMSEASSGDGGTDGHVMQAR